MFPLTFDGLLLVTVGFVVVRFVVAVGDGSHCGMLQTVTAVCFLPGLGHVHVSFLITTPRLLATAANTIAEMRWRWRCD